MEFATIFVPPVFQVLLENAITYGKSFLCRLVEGRDDLEKLQKSVDMARSILGNAEEQHANDALRYLLPRLEEAIYEADYVLLDQSLMRATSVLSDLETAVDRVLPWTKTDDSVDRRRRETSHVVKDSEIYGRNEDKDNIVRLLLPGPGEDPTAQGGDHVPCVIIEGMTAIGKTTLAQLVYKDEHVTQFFQANKVWVFVSHHSDAEKILTAVIRYCTREQCSFSDDLSRLHAEIECLLNKGRYLVVLDDVCIEKEEEWEKLRPLFQGSANGSRFLITTQNKRVADTMNISPHRRYNLNGLSEDHCYDVLKHHAFEEGEEETYPSLAHIGKEIARKCGGVALAAKSLGRLLQSKRRKEDWLRIRDNDLWNLDKQESEILQFPRLSYSRLPSHLRRCFAFCSIFPRGWEIKKEKLIHLWMAGGLISYDNITQSSSEVEDTGRGYFHDLLCKSFFEEEKRRDDGAVMGYKMHDAIYNLARSVSKSEYAILGPNSCAKETNFRRIRHSSLFRPSTIPAEICKAEGLLTFFLFSGGNFLRVPEKEFSNFKYLLLLNFSGSGVEILDGSSLSKLVHLRLLDLSYTSIKELPPEIKGLHFLHTLNLFNCYNLERLDFEFMKQVKHLNNAGCKALNTMIGFGKPLSGQYLPLERLPLFVICGPEDIICLQRLHLRGNLKITRLAKVRIPNGSFGTNQFLTHMDKLESLGLFWEDDDHRPNINPDEEPVESEFGERKQTLSSGSSSCQVMGQHNPLCAKGLLSHLRPPPLLKRLAISRYPGIDFPWEVPKYLNVIQLIGCRNIQHLPVLGDLPSLSSLLLQEMHALKCIEREFYGTGARVFPELKELTLIDFPDLEEWSSPDVAGAFPNLKKLIISRCKSLTDIPAENLKSIQHLELRHCKATLVRSFRGLTSLQTLVIEEVYFLIDFPWRFFEDKHHLTSLEIKHCSQLLELPEEVENCTSLKSLTIRWCEMVTSMPIRLYRLTALESLEISDCPALVSLPNITIGGFCNLRTLSIETCNNLKFLPRGLQYLTCLQHLSIKFCSILCALAPEFEHLSNLQSLTIRGCENIKTLPEGIQYLTALQHLSIQDCPELMERCKENGEDWPTIAHVPYKHIGG